MNRVDEAPGRRKLLAVIGTLALTLLSVTAMPSTTAGAAITTPVFAGYASNTSGVFGNISTDPYPIMFTAVGLTNTNGMGAFVGASYSPPSPGMVPAAMEDTSSSYIEYDFGAVTLTELAVYFDFLRPTGANGPTNWTISGNGTVSCAITAGLPGASIVGSTMTPDSTNYQSGSLLCSGSFSSIRFTKNGSLVGIDRLTVAVAQSAVTTPPAPPTPPTPPTPAQPTTPVAPAYTG